MKKNSWRDIFKGIGLLTQLGLTMIVNIGVGFYLGNSLDKLTSRGFFKLVGLMLGIASGFYSTYRLIKKTINSNKQEDHPEK